MGITTTYPEWGGGTRTLSGAGMTYQPLASGGGAYTKGGTLEGVSTEAIYRTTGVCIAAFVNKTYAHVSTSQLNALADAVTSWPATDLFPTYGYPPFFYSCPTLSNPVVATLPNVTDNAFVFDGARLDLVSTVLFSGHTITSQSQSSWADGWFRIVDPTRIEIYPPQGLAPGAHTLTVASPTCSSAPVVVTIQLTPTAILRAPNQTVGSFEAIASLGPNSPLTYAFLALAPDNLPTPIPGIANLGIGNFGTSMLVWPYAIAAEPVTHVFRWQVPDLAGYPPMYFQAALIDLLLPNPFPMATTNVEVVIP
jgi:hypothetical protein